MNKNIETLVGIISEREDEVSFWLEKLEIESSTSAFRANALKQLKDSGTALMAYVALLKYLEKK
jgi:hypothetical protein